MIQLQLSFRRVGFVTFRTVFDFPIISTPSGVAQWLACAAHNREVGGSKPLSAIIGFCACRLNKQKREMPQGTFSVSRNFSYLFAWDLLMSPIAFLSQYQTASA